MSTGSVRDWSDDPFVAFNFLVEIQGVISGGFTEVSGLQVELETFDYREGGLNDFMHRLPGPARYPTNVTLRRGLSGAELWSWHQDALAGTVTRRPASVLVLDRSGAIAWRWDFRDAYPVRWTGPELRAGSSTVAVEALEFAHRGLDPFTSGPEG